MTPAFFLIVSNTLPAEWKVIASAAIVLASAYQFTQADAKTPDHFFKGFPSYWNLVVFYLFIAKLSPLFNLIIIFSLVVLVFVPIKYLYLTRIDYVTRNKQLRIALVVATVIYGLATLGLLATYPNPHPLYVLLSWGFGILYVVVSLYRTFVPISTS